MSSLKRGRRPRYLSLLTLGLLLILSVTVSAQKKELEEIKKFIKKKRVNAAYVMAGQNMLNLSKLNSHLDGRGLPTVAENYFTYGIGGHAIHNKFVAGFEFHRFFEKKQVTPQAFNTNTLGKYTVVNLGYLLYSKRGMMIYPLAGLGLGELRLRVIENNIQSFGDITDYQKGSDSRTRSILVNLGLGMDYFFNFKKKKKGKNNLMIGVRMGYLLSAMKFDWSVNHVRVGDGPVTGLTGPYIRVIIGLGGWVEKLIEKAI